MIRREPLGRPVHAPTDESPALSPAWTGGGKRLFDLGVALLCLVLLAPLLVAVALMVRLTTPGPALFRHLTMRQALDLDVEYVRRQSFALDFGILLKTVPVVLSTHGAE